MEGVRPPPARARRPSAWEPIDPARIARTPDAYGVVLVANDRKVPLLVTYGVIRDETTGLLYDPRAKEKGAAYFQFIVTGMGEDARRLANEMYLRLHRPGETRLHWRSFGSR